MLDTDQQQLKLGNSNKLFYGLITELTSPSGTAELQMTPQQIEQFSKIFERLMRFELDWQHEFKSG